MTEQELDPRWIVREMGEEGKNVGNWHWTERNCIPWSEKTLSKLFDNFITQTPQFRAKITFSKITGDCIVMNRKGKFIAVFEIKIEFTYKSETFPTKKEDEVVEAKGKITIPYIGEESDLDEYEVKYELDDSNKLSKHSQLQSLVEKYTEKEIKSKVNSYLKELRAGADYKDLLVPSKHNISPFEEQEFKNIASKNEIKTEEKISTNTTKTLLTNVLSTDIKQSSERKQSLLVNETFKTTPEVIFQSFIDPRKVSAFTQSKPQVECKVGGNVDYYNGKLVGKITKISSNKLLGFSLRMSDWKNDHYSNVDLKFEYKQGQTHLTLMQTDIPEKDKNGGNISVKSLEMFWREMFLKRINVMFASGYRF